MPTPALNTDAFREATRVAFAAARSAADRHRADLMSDPNVIDVRAGYKFTNGWVTDTPAVVVVVLRKEPPEELSQVLPTELDGLPVDVAPATPDEQLRHLNAQGGTRSALATTEEELLAPGETPGTAEATRGPGRGGREYQEPAHLKLAAVSGAMTLLCHASPDAGWATLGKFLSAARKTLTVAMYDFGAPHIVEAIEGAMARAKGPFVLNLDRRSNPKREGELTEQQVVDRFTASLGDKFVSSTAAVGTLYPNAYHIKVAVRDGKVFWLSSGNWQGSNQPTADAAALDERGQRALFSKHNREWHVVCEHEKLAQTFEEYIKYDVAEAARVGERGVVLPPLPDLVVPVVPEFRAVGRPVKVFKPKKFTFTAADRVKVQPVLTPDNYGEHVAALIRSAKKSLYFQNQYIMIPKAFPDGAGKPALRELTEALLDRVNAGVDVRIILRNGGKTREMLQALKVYGIDMSLVRLLGGCHNKGIVVDSKAVLVSSQNYSADGVRFNRDAGLIVRHAGVAAYYEQVFLHDWDNRASQRISGEVGEMPLVPQVAERSARAARPRRSPGKTSTAIDSEDGRIAKRRSPHPAGGGCAHFLFVSLGAPATLSP